MTSPSPSVEPSPVPLRVAVVGSRGYPRIDLVRALVASLQTHQAMTGRPVVIVSGTEPPPEGVRRVRPDGVDETAIREARRLGVATEVYPAEWQRYGKKAGPLRNAALVAAARQVFAWWDGTSRGTADVIGKARAAGKLGAVYGPDGTPMPPPDSR